MDMELFPLVLVMYRLLRNIENQRAHHSNASFKEEYIGLLKRYNMDYDENFLW